MRQVKAKIKAVTWVTAVITLDDNNNIDEVLEVLDIDNIEDCELLEIK